MTEVRQIDRPNIWLIPGAGMAWCDCGADHELTRTEVEANFRRKFDVGGRVPHPEVVTEIRELWNYKSICPFFLLQVEESARAVVGRVDESYLFADAVDIAGWFTKTWQGCPSESCEA